MRFLLAVTGSRGDFQPSLALALRLRRAGHEVTLATAPDFEAQAAVHGFPHRRMGRSAETWLVEESGRIPHPLEFARRAGRQLREEVAAQLDALEPAVADADCVVGVTLLLAGASLARARRIPYRHVLFCPQPLPSDRHPPPLTPWQTRSTPANRTLWRVQRAFFRRFAAPPLDAWRAGRGLPPTGEVLADVCGQGVLVACDEELAPLPDDVPFPCVQTGTWLPEAEAPLPRELEAFLDAGAPPFYVGFGSMRDPEPAETVRQVAAAVARLGARVVLAAGLAAGLAEPLPHVHGLSGEVAHARLFPRLAAVVHHGGAGTTATAARAGVPQLLVPHFLDQYYWADHVHRRGLGPRPIRRSRLSAGRLARALAECLGSREMHARTRALAERLRGRDGIGEAVDALARAVSRGAARARRHGPGARAAPFPTGATPRA